MSGWEIPAEKFVRTEDIPRHRAARHPTKFKSCTQINQIFLKANGYISCSCMRYWDILADPKQVHVGEFANGELMQYIRESFRDGYEPFDFCEGCASRISGTTGVEDLITTGVALHIEPSSQCNLFCAACTCTFERLSNNPPPRSDLDFAIYEKVLRELGESELGIACVAFVGFGEPLFNSRTPDMVRLARSVAPAANLFLDTNGNFGERRAVELADCGLDEIRLGLDGMDQESYVGYRKSGNFAKAFAFARRLAAAIRETNSPTKVVWKYILFRHNDRDDQIIRAIELADEIGVPIIFDLTVGDQASSRTMADIQEIIGAHKLSCNIDREAMVDG